MMDEVRLFIDAVIGKRGKDEIEYEEDEEN